MRGLNRVTLIGNCGKEPEYKQLEDGTPVAKIALATTEMFRLKNGETQSRADWHTIILWRGLAGLAKEYVRKGSLLYVEGKLRNRQYDKEGVKKYVTEIVAEQVILLDKKTKAPENTDDMENEKPMPF